MSDYRWQGHSHEELFQQINEGPGADASTESVQRWRQLTRALNDVDNGLADALAAAMSGWSGEAADSAHGGLRPLGAWARQAQEAAELMRQRAEQQAEFVSKARRDMPEPKPVSAENPGMAQSMLTHLVGAQTDYEAQESQRDAAEQQAFAVMRSYESSTTSNTTSLASFTPPPQVVVDSPGASGSPGNAGGFPGNAGSPGAFSSPGASSGAQGITISWGGVPATSMPSPRAGSGSGGTGGATSDGRSAAATSRGGGSGRASAFRGVRASGSAVATGESSSTTSAGTRSSATNSATANSTSTTRGASNDHDTADEDTTADEPIDQTVTEEWVDSGGLFDEPRTVSRPVIGGQPQ